MKTETRVEVEVDYDSTTHEKLAGYISYLQESLDEIPDEFKEKAMICIEADTRYGEGGYDLPSLRIYYTRLETDEEEAAREGVTARYEKERRDDEIRTLQRLKAKYE